MGLRASGSSAAVTTDWLRTFEVEHGLPHLADTASARCVHRLGGDDVEAALQAADALVQANALRTVPHLICLLESMFQRMNECGPFAWTADNRNACVALALVVEPLLARGGDDAWRTRFIDLWERGLFNPMNL